MTDLLFIGAGLGALACAGDLGPVTVLDKGRAPSGRAATRRLGGATLDHGARFFTARTPRLRALAGAGVEAGWLRVWARGFPIWEGGRLEEKPDGHPRYAPTAGLRELGRRLYAGEVQSGVKVTVLEVSTGCFYLFAQALGCNAELPGDAAGCCNGDGAVAVLHGVVGFGPLLGGFTHLECGFGSQSCGPAGAQEGVLFSVDQFRGEGFAQYGAAIFDSGTAYFFRVDGATQEHKGGGSEAGLDNGLLIGEGEVNNAVSKFCYR